MVVQQHDIDRLVQQPVRRVVGSLQQPVMRFGRAGLTAPGADCLIQGKAMLFAANFGDDRRRGTGVSQVCFR